MLCLFLFIIGIVNLNRVSLFLFLTKLRNEGTGMFCYVYYQCSFVCCKIKQIFSFFFIEILEQNFNPLSCIFPPETDNKDSSIDLCLEIA